jgi:monoamine oxidase
MSRTALMQLLRRAYDISRLAAQTHIPPADLVGWLQNRSQARADSEANSLSLLSRRQVMQSLAGVGVGALTPRSLRQVGQALPESSLSLSDGGLVREHVLIVGAGVAGLTAAYRLRQAGVGVDVVEASRRAGGRLLSLSHIPGQVSTVELGGEFIDTRHTHIRNLAAELGLELADLQAADQGLEREILYFSGQRISETRVVEEFATLARQIDRDLKKLATRDITYQQPSPDAIRLDRMSLTEYLDAEPISPLINQLVKVAYITEFGRDPDSQSCLNMLFLIGSEVGKWSTYGISDERYHVVGGNDQIPKRLAERLTGQIEYGTKLESIRASSDGRYRVSLKQDNSSQDRIYDRVLITLPFSVLRNLELAVELPEVKQQAIQQLGYGTSSKLAVPYQERIWRTRYGCTISIYTDLPFQNTWESARYSAGPGGWVTDLRGGQQGLLLSSGNPETHAQQLTQDLEQIFPGIGQVQRGKALQAIWATNPYALGSYSCYLPGQWTSLGGSEVERVGNLWFAGEHCSLGSQGYMNGACETGEAAASAILADLKTGPTLS